ncbi:MAG: STAS domain-containing protein [Acidobacteria bacterium]|nr:STAS domain-containing protein [Acidobacteriota bacterium]
MPFSVDVHYSGGAAILALGDRLIGVDGTELRAQMLSEFEAGHKGLVLDCVKLAACDSFGLGELVAAHASIVRRGGQVKLARLHRRFEELLEITRLTALFQIYPNEASALASFTAAAGAKERAALNHFLNPDE